MNIEELSILIAEKDDENAFRKVFQHFYAGLLSFAISVIKDQQLAEEVVEDVFVKLWENRQTLPTINNLSYYLYVATKHASINCIKKRKRDQAMLTPVFEDQYSFGFNSPASDLISNENIQLINASVNTLPPRCRLIFRLIKTEGLSYSQVASLLNISMKTVEAQITIALRKMAECLADDMLEFRWYFNKKLRSK